MNRVVYTLFLFIFFLLGTLQAQPVNNDLRDVSMPAPNAASLGKFGEIPVGYYTGIPNVGIPLYTVKDGPITLPVALSYHAGGMRVGEPVSSVGLGWTLQAGGMISRTIQGKADESCDGYFMTGRYIALQNDTCVAPQTPYTYAQLQAGTADAEPDIFSFSVGGYSGKFYIEADMTNDNVINGKAILIPKQDVKITYVTSGSCGTLQLKQFTITTPDGTRYDFGNIDNNANNKGIELQRFNENFISASNWLLRKVTSADGNYAINLDYVQEKYRYESKASGDKNYNPVFSYPIMTPSGSYYHNVVDVLGWRLSTITTPGNLATVTFIASSLAREDLSTSPWNIGSAPEAPKTISTIKIESGALCKQFVLSQSYYVDATADKSGSTADKRLKLNSVQEKSCDNPITLTVNPYTFQYYDDSITPTFLPTRMSSAIDHWGFYNGASGNPHFGTNIPMTKLRTYVVGNNNVHPVKGGSNRETNPSKMRLGTLKKIIYPTGGSTNFEYEANTFYGTRDSLSFSNLGTMTRPGSDCSQDQSASASFTIPAQNGADLSKLYYTFTINPPAPYPGECQSAAHIDVRLVNASNGAQIAVTGYSLTPSDPTVTNEGILTELFSNYTIPAGVPLRFEFWAKAMTGTFTVKKLVTTVLAGNYPVGGLRVKKITSNDGVSTANDVVKSYVYDKAVIPGQSSAILYNKPVYGYVLVGCLGSCMGIRNPSNSPCPGTASQPVATHFFFETSIVPLSSFEGYHLGYSAVREYFNGSANGYYNLYQYYNEPEIPFDRIPIEPTQPRIGSGELESKAQRNASSGDVAYEIYEKRSETAQSGQGIYIKYNSYFYNGDPGGAGITFWKRYPIFTMPFRYEKITQFRDGQTTVVDKQYLSATHLQATQESLVNSDGKTTVTDYKYSFDMAGLPAGQSAKFNELNLLVPLQTTVNVDGTQVDGTQTSYDFFSTTTGARTSTAAGSFIRPYQFQRYEGSGWVLKGQVDSYHGIASTTGRSGMPNKYTKTGWQQDTYEWTVAGLLKKRTYGNFSWQYEYTPGTLLVSKVTNPDGQFTDYIYDKLMRLSQVKSKFNSGSGTYGIQNTYVYTYPTVNTSGIITAFGNVKSTAQFSPVSGSGLGTQETFQYFDGLGRDIETVFRGKASGGKDQIVAKAYDTQGRVYRDFMPFASTGSLGSYLAPGSAAYTFYDYEANPLSRPYRVIPPSWTVSQTTTYSSNTATDAVLNYDFSTGSSATFAADVLSKKTVVDGNGNKVITFTDKKGRALLSRRANSSESSKSDTYYIYDKKNRLVRVIPPGANWSDGNLVYTYQYTNNDLISQKKVPGKAYEAFEYNGRDLPIKYQDDFLRSNGSKWMGSKYDIYGRLTEKGVWSSGSGDALVLTNKIVENIYGTSGVEIDKLKTTKVQVFDSADPVVTPNPTPANNVIQTTFNYDTYGRVSGTTGNNHTVPTNLTAENLSYGYDFGDNILTENRTSINSAGTVTIVNKREFDAWSRLTKTTQNLNGAGEKTISELAYTDRDQLLWKKLGGGLQQLDYTYLPIGYLADINGTAALANSTYLLPSMLSNFNTPTFTSNNNADLFREVLRYDNPTGGLYGTPQYNGNVALMYSQVKGRMSQVYGFTYDYLDRMTVARYSTYTSTGALDPVDYFGEAMSYDARGNITSINRKGLIKGASSYSTGTVDNFTATIPSGTNFASQTTGTSSIPAANRNVDVPHNHLNLPIKFDFGSNNRINLLYDGLGNKLQKKVTANNVVTLTQDYLDGIELKNSKVDAVYNEEGRAFNTATSGQTYRYEFALRDHLGNTRVVFTDKGGDGIIQDNTEILSETHYYPFGKAFDGAWYNDATSPKYRYLYNGKELNDEFNLNFYDYGARWMDPGLGSWWEADPLGENSRRWSPYAYGNNNPIRFVDPDGMTARYNWATGAYQDENGNEIGYEEAIASAKNEESATHRTNTQEQSSGDKTTPWQIGWEWLTGTGPRKREFKDGDDFTELLRQHEHIAQVRAKIRYALVNGKKLEASDPYRLGGIDGIGKYVKDYTTLLTAGTTGNLAVTYLGSYALTFNVTKISGNMATVTFTVKNSSTINSATHPPVIGYTEWWNNIIGKRLNETFQSGPLSPTEQTITWTEQIKLK